MDEVKAASIVSALAGGVNPLTGEVFPPDSPYQSAEVVRALYTARQALEARNRTPARPRNLPANAGKPWNAEDDRRLLADFDRGLAVSELAQTLGRTTAGIQARLEKHGRLTAAHPGERPASRWRGSSARAE